MKTDEIRNPEKDEILQNSDEVLSTEAQETVEGGGHEQEENLQAADDWCLCNNLVINL